MIKEPVRVTSEGWRTIVVSRARLVAHTLESGQDVVHVGAS